jgi:nitroreductase
MCMFDPSVETVLEEIINARRTYRMLRPEVPPKDQISEIIQAGLAAPFAAAAVGGIGNEYFRRFLFFSGTVAGLLSPGAT